MKHNLTLIVFLLAFAALGLAATLAPYWMTPAKAAMAAGAVSFIGFSLAVGLVSEEWKSKANYIASLGEGRMAVFPAYTREEAFAMARKFYPNAGIRLSDITLA